MTRARAETPRVPNHLMADYYVQRSLADLLPTEATTISEEANGWNESPGIYAYEMTEEWHHTTNAVHDKGNKSLSAIGLCIGEEDSKEGAAELPVNYEP
jgi:N-ethylmaleimide reductase